MSQGEFFLVANIAMELAFFEYGNCNVLEVAGMAAH